MRGGMIRLGTPTADFFPITASFMTKSGRYMVNSKQEYLVYMYVYTYIDKVKQNGKRGTTINLNKHFASRVQELPNMLRYTVKYSSIYTHA